MFAPNITPTSWPIRSTASGSRTPRGSTRSSRIASPKPKSTGWLITACFSGASRPPGSPGFVLTAALTAA